MSPLPFVLVPGMLETTLLGKDSALLWGENILINALNLKKLSLPKETWDFEAEEKPHEILTAYKIFPPFLSFSIYKPLLNLLEQKNFKNELFLPFVYDWRLDVPYNAKLFRQYLISLSQKYSEVNMLASSMGTLLCLEALRENPIPNFKIKNLILVAPPILGSPVAQRVFHKPRHIGTKISGYVAPEILLTLRSMYYLLPEKKLSRHEKQGKTYLSYEEGGTPAPWIDPEFINLAPSFVETGLAKAEKFRSRWLKPRTHFPNIEKPFVLGSKNYSTYALPGDNTVLAESVEACADIFQTKVLWVDAPHERFPSSKILMKFIEELIL